MKTRQMTANASHLIVEQLAASGVKYVFNNSGSREALFFNELHSRPDIHGILGLHEGAVTAMAGGYTQANLQPGVMVVHLVLQRRVMRKHAQVFFFSYGPFIMGDSHSFVASFKIRPRVTL